MNRRKQKLDVKVEMSAETQEEQDPFLTNDANPTWFLDNENSDIDISPSLTSIDDDFLHLLDIPLGIDDGPLSQENKEIFQDLQFTSTPKSRASGSKVLYDSGIDETILSKKIKTEPSCNTLHDITDKFDSSCNSFINLSQLSDTAQCENSVKKHVSILRKDIITKPKEKHETTNKTPISPEQLIFYTGIKNFIVAVGIIKHLKLPKCKYSSFKMELITFMKIRLNLQWKDMGFRFSIPEKDLCDLTSMTIDVMNFAFNDLLPWHVQRKVMRRAVKCFYGHTLFCESTGIQVLVLLVDAKRPVLFVSSAHSLEKPSLCLLNDCAKYLISGDVICLCDVQGIRNYYKVERSNSGLTSVCLSESSFDNCPFVENCQKIVLEILSEFSIILKPETGMDLVKLIKIAAALTNINSVNEVQQSILGKIYQRSCQFISENSNEKHIVYSTNL